MINYLLLISRQGKLRLQKWYITLPFKDKAKIIKDVTTLALGRRGRVCNFLEYKGAFIYEMLCLNLVLTLVIQAEKCIVYRRYASLFFICEIDEFDNELATLEIIHRYVEILDRYFGEVCELDLIFNFQEAYSALDQLILAGELQEPSRRQALEDTRGCDVAQIDEDFILNLEESGLF